MLKRELSPRAEKVLEWIRESRHTGLACPIGYDPVSSTGSRLGGQDDSVTLAIRQQTLADLLGCSRRSIYRALKQLKEQDYLIETGKREKRCKVYEVQQEPSPDFSKEKSPSPKRRGEMPHFAKFFLQHCRYTIEYNMHNFPEWEKFLPEATYKLRHLENQDKFWRLMFDNLYLIQERETGEPNSARINNPDSTLFGVPYPKKPPPENLEHRMRTVPAYRPLR